MVRGPIRYGIRYSATRQFVSTTALHLRRGFCTSVLFIYEILSLSPFIFFTAFSSDSYRIRKYGSTFYIGIAMVILPYFGPMGKLKFQFSLSVSTQFDFYQHQSGEHVES